MLRISTRQKQIQRIIQQIRLSPSWQGCVLLSTILLLSSSYAVSAQQTSVNVEAMVTELKVGLDTLFQSYLVV